jgi:hypothetical protein
MNTKDTANLLKVSANEIKHLREINSRQSARLDMFDKMMLLFTSMPSNGCGNGNGMMYPDVVYDLTEAADRLEKEDMAPKQATMAKMPTHE